MNRKLFLYAHGGSGNHGCEAIVRATVSIMAGWNTRLFSYRPEEDQKYGVDLLCSLVDKAEAKTNRWSLKFIKAYLSLIVKKDYDPLDRLALEGVLSLATADEIAFSIGGDNYCYASTDEIMDYRALLEKRHIKTVLWGCSVEPDNIDKTMRQDLSRYNLITARESITYDALCAINPNTVLAPDPAFTLLPQAGNMPAGLDAYPFIGINVSPLIQNLETRPGITLENYQALIRYILETTDCNVALIPHVVWAHNDDRIPLQQLYEVFWDSGRVFMVEDQNCMQLKDIISRSEFFIGARTHATIAAYSTCVPTLVVGYSVKARGIARDLFGTEKGYVLPVQQLEHKEDLMEAFKALYARKDEIRNHLSSIMPGYIAGIEKAKQAVERL